MKKVVIVLLTLSMFACGSKKESKQTENSEKPIVSVVNYPLYYFAQTIAGEFIDLKYLIPDDVDPAYWVPNSESLSAFQESDIIFTNGADYAKWMNNVSLPDRIIVNTSEASKEKYIEVQLGASHSHGDGGEHVHTGLAFTTWLDLGIALEQARSIKNELVKLLPEKVKEIENNFTQLETDLLALHNQLKNISTDKHFIGSHPVYQYLAKAYELKISSVHFEPNEMPSHDQWHELDHLLDHYPSAVMIWEDEPIVEIKDELKKRKIDFIVFSPCGNKPSSGDFISVFAANVKVFTEI